MQRFLGFTETAYSKHRETVWPVNKYFAKLKTTKPILKERQRTSGTTNLRAH